MTDVILIRMKLRYLIFIFICAVIASALLIRPEEPSLFPLASDSLQDKAQNKAENKDSDISSGSRDGLLAGSFFQSLYTSSIGPRIAEAESSCSKDLKSLRSRYNDLSQKYEACKDKPPVVEYVEIPVDGADCSADQLQASVNAALATYAANPATIVPRIILATQTAPDTINLGATATNIDVRWLGINLSDSTITINLIRADASGGAQVGSIVQKLADQTPNDGQQTVSLPGSNTLGAGKYKIALTASKVAVTTVSATAYQSGNPNPTNPNNPGDGGTNTSGAITLNGVIPVSLLPGGSFTISAYINDASITSVGAYVYKGNNATPVVSYTSLPAITSGTAKIVPINVTIPASATAGTDYLLVVQATQNANIKAQKTFTVGSNSQPTGFTVTTDKSAYNRGDTIKINAVVSGPTIGYIVLSAQNNATGQQGTEMYLAVIGNIRPATINKDVLIASGAMPGSYTLTFYDLYNPATKVQIPVTIN